MTKIFISYPRVDSQYVTDSIHDHFIRHFGRDNVFLDVGSIPFGVDFREHLRDQVAAHDVVLVIIGPDWGRIMRERAGQTNDFVRIEIENALKMGKLVIPVLVKNADMPDFSKLPESVQDLQWRNSAVIRRKPDLEGDCQRLADGIKAFFDGYGGATTPKPPPTSTTNPASAEAVRDIIGGPFDWCEVPAGEFLYGDDKQKLTLPDFFIAKYPITYSQFQVFIDDKEGFYDDRWWEGLAADEDDRSKPGDQEWKIADHPRETVSWYDAMAFCRWLSHKLTGRAMPASPLQYDPMNAATWLVRLPTEFEWEKAARGTNGLVYPYGNEFDKSKCNTEESGIGKTTPVTQYPQGASSYGVLDMAGNVWEWCLTDYNDPVQNTVNENISSNSGRVLRGGSWYLNLNSARAAYRDLIHPNFRDYNRGFVLLCRPPSS